MRLNDRAMDPASLQSAAGRLGAQWPLERCPAEVQGWLETPAATAGAWIVMCSGGADSMALLLWLWGAFPARRENLRVLHVNHGTRGTGSEADASFVVECARALLVGGAPAALLGGALAWLLLRLPARSELAPFRRHRPPPRGLVSPKKRE